MCFRVRSCQGPLKDVSVMLCVIYVVTVIALGVLTSETKSIVYNYTYISTHPYVRVRLTDEEVPTVGLCLCP